MKLRIVLIALSLAASHASAVTYEAYVETLEDDLLCKDYPKISLPMHHQFLIDTGAIPKATVLGRAHKLYSAKVAPGYAIFGRPFKSIGFVPASKIESSFISAEVTGKPSEIAKIIAPLMAKRGLKSQTGIADIYSFVDETKGYAVTIGPSKSGGTDISCGTFVP